MVNTKHRQIKNFSLDTINYRKFKHKYEPSNICEMPIKWKRAKDFYVFDDNNNKWIDMTSGIFVTNAGHSNTLINEAIKKKIDKDLTFAYQYNTEIRYKFIKKLLDKAENPMSTIFEGKTALTLQVRLNQYLDDLVHH